VSDIQLDYRVPSPDLADHVTLFYDFRANVPWFEDMERADYAQFRFRLSPGFAAYYFSEGEKLAGLIHVVGPTSGATRCRVEGPVSLFGFGITPAGWNAMLGGDASDMLDDAMDIEGDLRARAEIAYRSIAATQNMDERVLIAEALIRELTCKATRESVSFAHQVDEWLEGSTSPDIDDLIAVTGLSRRQVERKCNTLYGAPPKLLARKYRALRAAVAMCRGDITFDDAVGRGFYDQSHLIREVKQFTGLTPKQIRDQPTALAAITVAQRIALGGQVKTLISET
jgi:AraC-like DNA-binding protein